MIAVLAMGCEGRDTTVDSGTSVRPAADLVDMSAWIPGDEALGPDPLPSHRPAGGTCPDGSVLVEGASVEIQSGICTYAWLQQPALVDLVAGEAVELVFWHSALVAESPAEGHLALYVDGEALYDRTVAIPADAAAYTETAVVATDSPQGAIVTLHLHNHGVNTWNLLRVERTGD